MLNAFPVVSEDYHEFTKIPKNLTPFNLTEIILFFEKKSIYTKLSNRDLVFSEMYITPKCKIEQVIIWAGFTVN